MRRLSPADPAVEVLGDAALLDVLLDVLLAATAF
jgi:hypothetical protein